MLDSEILEELGFIFLSLNNKPEALHYLGQAIVQSPQNQDVIAVFILDLIKSRSHQPRIWRH